LAQNMHKTPREGGGRSSWGRLDHLAVKCLPPLLRGPKGRLFPRNHALAHHTPRTRRSAMEDTATVIPRDEAWEGAGVSLPIGEPVTLVIDDERFFGWVVPASQAHSLACITIEFKRGFTRVRELIPVENIQRLRDYVHTHPEVRRRSTVRAE
jgi:hypothetical protein